MNEKTIEILKTALMFYAYPKHYLDFVDGDRSEFGCGCCAGIYRKEGGLDYDDSIVGLTAREALARIESGAV